VHGLVPGDTYGFSKACMNLYTTAMQAQHPRLFVQKCSAGFINWNLVKKAMTTKDGTPKAVNLQIEETIANSLLRNHIFNEISDITNGVNHFEALSITA
jgi:hypothetical protein